jgi:Tol biopolymer transport system component
VPRVAGLLVVLGLLLALGAAVLWIGTRPRLPQPFGPARNGAIVSSHDGDIYAVDAVTHAERQLIGGSTLDFAPAFSRDGTMLMFLRGSGIVDDASGLKLVVANADGTGVHELTGPTVGLDWLDWSPDSRQIAFLSSKDDKGPRVINVINADGTGLTTLDVGRPAFFVSWLPPLGREIVFRSERLTPTDPPPGIWAVHPDGTGLRELTSRPAINAGDFESPALAPDGSRISYTASGPVARIHVLDLQTGTEIVLPSPNGVTSQQGSAFFSPDGRLVGYVRVDTVANTYQFVIAPADGSGTGVPVGPRLKLPMGDVNWTFTPDGSAVVVDYGADGSVQLLPVDGSPGTLLTRGDLSFADIQRLAP